MERLLFLDNFRGFSNELIEFKNVNFFLGENSTGKTSVLSAVKLLSELSFWFREDFNNDEINLGNFSDIVSIETDDPSYFSLGYCFHIDKKVSTFRIARFENKEGIPYATTSIIYENGKLFYALRKIKSIYYKFDEVTAKNPVDLFREIIKNIKNDITELKEFKVGERINNFPFLMHSQSIIAAAEQNKNENKMHFSFASFANDPVWLAPIRTKPKRTYDEPIREFTSDGRHTPFLIKKQISNKTSANRFVSLLKDVGIKGCLFKDVKIKNYGKENSSPFQVQIILDRKPLGIHNVGYGVSQSLPVIVELLCHPKGDSFIIQQPEVHLHPKAQAAIGELVFLLAQENKTLFFIETHSDYLIDRYRIKIRESKEKPSSQVLFFQRKKSKNIVSPIQIDSEGDYSKEQPIEFREFFIAEEMRKMGI